MEVGFSWNCQSRFTFLYFFFWALESFASLCWLAVAVSTSKLFLLLYVSRFLADMYFYIRIFIFIFVFLFLYLFLLLLGCGSQPHFWMETQNWRGQRKVEIKTRNKRECSHLAVPFSLLWIHYSPSSYCPTILLLGFFSFLYPLENSSRKIHFAPLSGFFYQQPREY